MKLSNYIIIMVMFASDCISGTRKKPSQPVPPLCANKNACENRKNKRCSCYCAFKPGPRRKERNDTPIFIKNDSLGNYCYCQQRDLDKLGISQDQDSI